MITDPISDMLTSIRNATTAGHEQTMTPASNAKKLLLQVLIEEGFVAGYEDCESETGKPAIRIFLRYTNEGQPAVREVRRLSKPGRRWYVRSNEIPVFKGGLGVVVVSTSEGMLSDREARKRGIGGELICSLF